MIAKPTPAPKIRKPIKREVHRIPDSIREQVFGRDSWTCQWCRVPGGALDLHHRLARSQSGKDDLATLVAVHRICHSEIHREPLESQRRGFIIKAGSA